MKKKTIIRTLELQVIGIVESSVTFTNIHSIMAYSDAIIKMAEDKGAIITESNSNLTLRFKDENQMLNFIPLLLSAK